MSLLLESYLETLENWKKDFGFSGRYMTWEELDEVKALDPKLVWTLAMREFEQTQMWAVNGFDLTLTYSEDPKSAKFLICQIPCEVATGTKWIPLDFEEQCESCEAGEADNADECENCDGEGFLWYDDGVLS